MAEVVREPSRGPLLTELAFTGHTTLPIDSFSIARFAPLSLQPVRTGTP